MKRLSTEPELVALTAQYVPLKLDTKDPEFQKFASKYRPTGRGIPMIFIIDSSGKEIYNKSGAPSGAGLATLLKTGIEQTGGIKRPKDAGLSPELLTRIADKVEAELEDGDIRGACQSLTPLFKQWQTITEIEDPTAQRVVALFNKLNNAGLEQVENANAMLATENRELLGLVLLYGTERKYEPLPPVAEKLAAAMKTVGSDDNLKALLPQAKLIDRARVQDELDRSAQAVIIYQRVIDDFPGTQAAQLCQLRINQLKAQ